MRLHTTFNVLALAVVDSRTLAGVLGRTHRNYLQAIEANAPGLKLTLRDTNNQVPTQR